MKKYKFKKGYEYHCGTDFKIKIKEGTIVELLCQCDEYFFILIKNNVIRVDFHYYETIDDWLVEIKELEKCKTCGQLLEMGDESH